ncbi:hypothetical protein BDR06DRAFT_1043087 [Suillus hirtellus]|nr:hypothetical protein BDR06DRAFT_1043087 [Suillus hirtellus]
MAVCWAEKPPVRPKRIFVRTFDFSPSHSLQNHIQSYYQAMSRENHPARMVRNAKKAIDKEFRLPEKTRTNPRKQHQATKDKKGSQLLPDSKSVINTEYNEPLWGLQPRSMPKSTKKHSRESTPVSKKDYETEAVKRKRKKKSSTESEEAEDRIDTDLTRFSAEESYVSDIEDPKSIAKTLSMEMTTFVSGCKEKKSLGLPVNKHSARARKQVEETPVWPDDIISESEEPSSANHSPASLLKYNTSTFVNSSKSQSTIDHASSRATSKVPMTVYKAKSEPDMSDTELKSDVSIIINIESGTSTHKSGSRGATELLLTKDGKVKLTDQNSVTRRVVQGDILEAKAHMTFTSGYAELTENAFFSRQSLLKAARKFQDDDVPKSVKNKFYLGDIMVHLMKGRYFDGPKCTQRSSGRHTALRAKFDFTGNQLSEVYFFHVKFVKDLSAKLPDKFHKLMADIFATIQYDLMQYNNSATNAEAEALAFLYLDGMDED